MLRPTGTPASARCCATLLSACLALACSSNAAEDPDAGGADATRAADATPYDATPYDAFDPSPPDASSFDASSFDASSFDAPPLDAPPPDASPPDASPPDASPPDAAGCGVLTADPSDVYVDRSSSLASMGTATCPFLTVLEATSLSAPGGTRAIHVKGGTPVFVYDEAGVIVLRTGEALVGDGETTTRITGGGSCTIGDCVVSLRKGSLSGVTVVSSTGSAIEIPTGNDGSSVDNVTARDSADNGFYVRASATLSNVTASGNGRDGLNARFGVVTITNSRFDGNRMRGIYADRAVAIDFRGGSVSGNRSDGISVQNSATVTGAVLHTLTGLQIIQNLGYGIDAAGTASLLVRATTMRGNEAGLVFRYGVSNTLDVGTAASSGDNVFGGATPGQRNIRAGLCLEQSGATASQAAEGNSWGTCPPSQKEISSFTCRSLNTYADVGYIPAAAGGAPVIPPVPCTVGP